MARPKHDNPELFTVGEIAHATEVSSRNMQLLADRGLTPVAHQEADGKAGATMHDIAALMHFAMVGALNKSGLPLLHSARICMDLRWEFNEFDLGYMSGLARQRFGMDAYPSVPEGGDFYFWFHHLLRTASDSYRPNVAWDNDIVLLIADRRYALLDIHRRDRRIGRAAFGDGHTVEAGPDPFCEINVDSDFQHSMVVPLHERDEWGTPELQLALLDEYRSALDNAVGVTRANLSLAIRRCLDRVHDLRMEKGGKLFPQ